MKTPLSSTIAVTFNPPFGDENEAFYRRKYARQHSQRRSSLRAERLSSDTDNEEVDFFYDAQGISDSDSVLYLQLDNLQLQSKHHSSPRRSSFSSADTMFPVAATARNEQRRAQVRSLSPNATRSPTRHQTQQIQQHHQRHFQQKISPKHQQFPQQHPQQIPINPMRGRQEQHMVPHRGSPNQNNSSSRKSPLRSCMKASVRRKDHEQPAKTVHFAKMKNIWAFEPNSMLAPLCHIANRSSSQKKNISFR